MFTVKCKQFPAKFEDRESKAVLILDDLPPRIKTGQEKSGWLFIHLRGTTLVSLKKFNDNYATHDTTESSSLQVAELYLHGPVTLPNGMTR